MPKLKPLNRQTIVITGGTSGIGLTIARRAAEEGAKVVLVARSEEALRAVSEDIAKRGGQADYISGDVGIREDMRRVVDMVVERHGGFDTWVNDAGVGVYATLEETTDEDHERLFRTNYWGVVYGSTEALKHLKRRGGALINIGSISSDMPAPILSAYTASKHAVKGFTDSLRLELMHEDAPVSVTLIKPSGIHTPYGDHAQNYMEQASRVPPPVYHPDLVADAVLHAAETPTREIMVGGSGLLQTSFAYFAPHLADRFFSWAFFKLARDPSRSKRNGKGLHEPGDYGRQLGDQSGYLRRTSFYTAAQIHPMLAFGLKATAVVMTAAAASAVARRRRHNRAGSGTIGRSRLRSARQAIGPR